MKSLKEYITEASHRDEFGTIIQSVDIDPTWPEEKLIKTVKDTLIKAVETYKVIRVGAVEKANEEEDIKIKKRWEDALKQGEKDILALMQSKPGILRRSPAKRQEWVDEKIKKLKADMGKDYYYIASYCDVEFDEKEMNFQWFNDTLDRTSFSRITGMHKLMEAVKYIVLDILKKPDFKHLISIQILAQDFVDKWPRLNIFPVFDEEHEKTLDAKYKKFVDFMLGEYGNGRYMGD